MKNLIIILVLATFGLAAQASTETEERTTKQFTAIENNCSADVNIKQGNEYKISVTANEKYLQKIEIKVVANTLVIDIKGNIYNTDVLRVDVTVVDLSEIVMNSSGDITIFGQLTSAGFLLEVNGSGDFEGDFNVKDMEVSLRGSGDAEISGINGSLEVSQGGSGDFEATDLHLGNCYFKMNSSGDTDVSGTAAIMELRQSGSGDFDGRSFKVKTAKVRKSSSGEADVYVTGTIDAGLSGSGDLTIKGSPEITDFSSTGSGDIRSL